MKDPVLLLAYLLTTLAKLLGPGGAKAILVDSRFSGRQHSEIKPGDCAAGVLKCLEAAKSV